MSSEAVVSKRKASAKDARPAKKVKSAEKANKPAVNEKLKATAEAKKTRKRASDFIDEDSTAPAEPIVESPRAKKVKISKKVEIVEPLPSSISKSKPKGKSGDKKKVKEAKDTDSQALVLAEQEEEIALPASDDGDEEDVAALLAGFSSDEDEESDKEGGVSLDLIPEAKLDKKAKKALEKAKKNGDDEDTPGTIYVGRIPHGFYEPQMRAYFTQFGTILNLRLSRNKKTGASKHYAFIQFTSSEVADIVARTMNNYLMFGHILKVRLIPAEQVHPEMWKGANKRFKVMPRTMLERKDMERPKGRDYWKSKVDKESKKRDAKRKAMEELGYTYEAPELKKVDDVPMKEDVVVEDKAADKDKDAEVEEAPKAIAEAPAEVDEVQLEVEKVVKNAKKEKKEKVKVKVSKKAKA